ncbi:hypothetical protein OAL67_00470 [bacterium]|nr:hypothetical protein [bacterium]
MYNLVKPGAGHAPHILENESDASDKIFLCSCGGTKNPNGHCDGSHAKKGKDGCTCYFCKKQEDRIQ